MRASVISAVLLIAVLIIVFSSAGWLSGFFQTLFDLSNKLPENITDTDDERISDVTDTWARGKFAVLLFFDKAEIDSIDKAVNDLNRAYTEQNNEKYKAAKDDLIYEIKQVSDMIKIKAENIF